MLKAISNSLSTRLKHWIPDTFVFAIILTIITAIMAVTLTDTSINKVTDDWYKGFWMLLEFGMQMVLILATGYSIALSPFISKLIDKLATLAKTPGKVYLLVMFIGALFALVSWGWVVLTAVLARELGKRVDGIDYAYLVACVYISGAPWVAGLSSSIPLVLNTEGNFLISTGVLQDLIPVNLTLGSLLNYCYLGAFVLTFPLLMWLLKPKTNSSTSMGDLLDDDHREMKSVAEEALSKSLNGTSLSDRLNNGRWLQMVIAIAAAWFIFRYFLKNGFDINLNIMIFLFIAIGLIAHQTPMRYVVAMKRSCSNVSGIIFQYPFYAGIMGIMMFSGLGAVLSNWMASGASIESLPFWALFSGAVINFAIPSAGGEWAVIGPALTETALTLTQGLPAEQIQAYVARIAMATAYGETSSNLLQPFFLLIILPIMGAGVKIQARDVVGYLLLPFIYLFVMSSLLVTFVPL
ncbi:TIGR00366 family protein [Alteromonadaceae bacterium BrNp21-10]|nr:TIGR00366 family protein [Alteromonadaceae bacterium BrNp21-10]